MEKEKKLKGGTAPEPDLEFLKAMVLLEKLEMLKVMEEFHLDSSPNFDPKKGQKPAQGPGGAQK